MTRWKLLTLAPLTLLFTSPLLHAQETAFSLQEHLDIVWVLLAGVLVFFMAGRICLAGNRHVAGQECGQRHDEELHGCVHGQRYLLADWLQPDVWRKRHRVLRCFPAWAWRAIRPLITPTCSSRQCSPPQQQPYVPVPWPSAPNTTPTSFLRRC